MKPQRCIVPMRDHLAVVEEGDCWRACIATVIELPAADVPNFVDLGRDGFLDLTRAWLADRGWAVFAEYYTAKDWPLERLVAWLAKAGPGVAFIITGRSDDFDHALIALDGEIHDPSDAGISGPHICKEEGCECGGFWWVYVLTRHHGGEK